jgi:hypothetical protein
MNPEKEAHPEAVKFQTWLGEVVDRLPWSLRDDFYDPYHYAAISFEVTIPNKWDIPEGMSVHLKVLGTLLRGKSEAAGVVSWWLGLVSETNAYINPEEEAKFRERLLECDTSAKVRIVGTEVVLPKFKGSTYLPPGRIDPECLDEKLMSASLG